jgi:hypothetical protein
VEWAGWRAAKLVNGKLAGLKLARAVRG